jgi:rubrerythrin
MPILSTGEVVKLGIEVEKNGRDFYISVAASSKNIKARELFLYLADEELKHEKIFEAILNDIGKYELQEPVSDESEYYLQGISGEYVFTQKDKGKEIGARVKNDLQAIELAIGFEKDSILLFNAMKDKVSEAGRITVDKLVKQEKEHLLKLAEIKESYNA